MSLTTSAISVEIARKLFSNYIYQTYEEHISNRSNNFVNLCTREIERFTESIGGLFILNTDDTSGIFSILLLKLSIRIRRFLSISLGDLIAITKLFYVGKILL